jgi:hypothetical protein
MGCADCDWQVTDTTKAAERTKPLPVQKELDTTSDSTHVPPAAEPVISSNSFQAPPASEPVSSSAPTNTPPASEPVISSNSTQAPRASEPAASSNAADTPPTSSTHVSEVRCFQGPLSLPLQCVCHVVSAACAFALIDLHSSLASACEEARSEVCTATSCLLNSCLCLPGGRPDGSCRGEHRRWAQQPRKARIVAAELHTVVQPCSDQARRGHSCGGHRAHFCCCSSPVSGWLC